MTHHFHLKAPVGLLLLILTSASSSAAEVHCIAVSEDQDTFGARQDHRYSPRRSLRAARGRVESVNGEPLSEVLVEVFDHPDRASFDSPVGPVGKRRVAACLTNVDGKFSFKLSPGEYALRFSQRGGWDWTTFFIKIGRFSIGSHLTIVLEVAT